MPRGRYPEQLIELLDLSEVDRAAFATRFGNARRIARALFAVILDHAAMHDEIIVSANVAQHLAALRTERVEIADGIGFVSKADARPELIGRSILRNGRVGLGAARAEQGRRVPIEVAIVLVPMHLGPGQSEQISPVPHRRIASRVAVVPDLLAVRIARAVPDLVHRLGSPCR